MDLLISQISNANIVRYFRSKVGSFRFGEERFDHIVAGIEHFSNLTKLGEIQFQNSDELLVFSCKSNSQLSERSSKKKQFDIAKKVLTEDFKDGAIFVFYDTTGKFRFSFIRKNYGDKDKKYSNWKRYTYYVDPEATNKTFRDRVGVCRFESLEEIQQAFSVEPLNKEFYDKIVRAFYSLVGGEVGSGRNRETLKPTLKLPGGKKDRTTVRQFGVRLIGRIIFCWFLKHKTSKNGTPLIPSDWLSTESISEDYYHSTLELLFFEILNRKQEERHRKLPEGHEIIPFLNGGLFEPQEGVDSDHYDPHKRSFDQRASYELVIKDKWFEDLFEVLEQYNFTIDENSINDAEVSIDPEMLGRIFENLLAEIDPNLEEDETKSVRKATGSYYTPREIVDYMAEEALVKYLHIKTGYPEKRLHRLFGDDTSFEFSEAELDKLMTAFDEVKILDPAAGSGAFPMGCLHKIVTALQKLDPGAEKWKKKQLDKISNAAVKAEMKQILDKSNAEYARKLGVLQQCIYGADIQPIAAEISRLRSFLSLIVDEDIDDRKTNRGVIALPNLEFKFVTANTLMGLDSTVYSSSVMDELLQELQTIRTDFLQAHGDEKDALRKRFKKIQKAIWNDQRSFDPEGKSRSMQLANWEPFQNEVSPWFDSEWMFGVKQFDIVIGNPPYGGTKIPEALKSDLGLGSRDPYGAFIVRYLRKPVHITPLKNGGILAFIVSDTFMTIKSHKPLRDFIMENRIHSMIRVHPDTFKATVNTAVILIERTEQAGRRDNKILMADFTNTSIHENHDRFVKFLDKVTDYGIPTFLEEAIEKEGVLYIKGEGWTSESSEEFAIYTYPQSLILTNTNHPFFTVSPKLFKLMNDTTSPVSLIDFQSISIASRIIELNSKSINIFKLSDVADVKHGMTTGDNFRYLRKEINARGNYEIIDKSLILPEVYYTLLDENERKYGFDESKFDGKYFVPYDKGGQAEIESGWMPNYWVPTEYYIDWRKKSVKKMMELVGHRHDNPHTYFKAGLTFSITGFYAPTFRFSANALYDVKGSAIFSAIDSNYLLGSLNSKIAKMIAKGFVYSCVDTQVDAVKEIVISPRLSNVVGQLIQSITSKQRRNSTYDYQSNEQLIIDFLVYQAYGMNWHDIQEVENWYARRYPKLVAAQKRNLQALGKPTDYLQIYKELEKKYGALV